MNHHYRDIRDEIPHMEPRWWDEYAVPRYCAHSPDEVANIYADEVAFVEIACQDCGQRFLVAFSRSHGPPLSEVSGELHYGDPPNVGCCPAGPTMNSVPLRIVEFWRLTRDPWGWERDAVLEREITPDWAEGSAALEPEAAGDQAEAEPKPVVQDVDRSGGAG